jgi:hypothetical protein
MTSTLSNWTKVLCVLAIVMPFGPALAGRSWDTKKPQLYALGVEIGFASVHSVAAASTSDIDKIHAMDKLTVTDILALEPLATSIAQNGGPQLAPIDSAQLLAQNAFTLPDLKRMLGVVSNSIVSARDGMTATLSKNSPAATNAYLLGVNMGIAEAQATVGEPARTIVFQSLINVRNAALALGLATTPIDQCLYFEGAAATPAATAHLAMPELYTQILSARSTYQNLL